MPVKNVIMEKEIYYIVISVTDKNLLLKNEAIAWHILKVLTQGIRDKYRMELFCYTLVPQGLHLVLSPFGGHENAIQSWVSGIKRKISRDIKKIFNAGLAWERGFRMEKIQNRDHFTSIRETITVLPVAEGLVPDGHDYRFARFIRYPLFPGTSRSKKDYSS